MVPAAVTHISIKATMTVSSTIGSANDKLHLPNPAVEQHIIDEYICSHPMTSAAMVLHPHIAYFTTTRQTCLDFFCSRVRPLSSTFFLILCLVGMMRGRMYGARRIENLHPPFNLKNYRKDG